MNLSAETEEEAMFDDIASMPRTVEEKRENLMPILQEILEKYQYHASPALEMVAEHLGSSTSDVYGVAAFCNQFRFNPPGKHTRSRFASERPAT